MVVKIRTSSGVTKVTGARGGRTAKKVATRVDVWYDRGSRSWVVQRKDRYGNQVGEADYVGRKEHALELKGEYLKKIRKAKRR